MEHFFYFLFFAISLAMIIKGSDWFLDSAVWAAEVFHVPQVIIGATIISVCTTLPETFVSVSAVIYGETDMAIGNSIGSIACNVGLILGILIFFGQPNVGDPKNFRINSIWLITAIVFTWIMGFWLGEINRTAGILLLCFLVLYILQNIRSAVKQMDLSINYDLASHEEMSYPLDLHNPMPEGVEYDKEENDFNISITIIINKILYFLLGITLVVWGSSILIENGVAIAHLLGVPPILIAVTFTSLGTSLPELVTTISSIRKGVSNLGVGNIIGASILNIIQVIGISAIFGPIRFGHDSSVLFFQMPAMLLIVLCGILSISIRKGSTSRVSGLLLLLLYFLFVGINILRENTPIIGPLLF